MILDILVLKVDVKVTKKKNNVKIIKTRNILITKIRKDQHKLLFLQQVIKIIIL